ncbi:PD-(D/E)XK nuclease family protein [Scrofimicrobium sp. R131]|uniref:PD-(D/E)XK nuclease family protein n=1 Tax=Scrofimicrobium appendicitidis TaxID=3079930 RepID=A0AAU7V7B6_9ACTO
MRAPALSASSSREYLQCPLKFRYSVVDRIPQPPTAATIRGILVHSVLEHLYGLAAADRTWEAALDLLPTRWEHLEQKEPEYSEVIESVPELLAEAQKLLQTYFTLENPHNLEPEARESFVEARLPSGLMLRGIVDRIDRAPDGRRRVVDYKTGKSPSPRFLDESLFQMRFYALLLREVGRAPSRMQLLYLKDGQTLTLDPNPEDVDRFEGELLDLWHRIAGDLGSGQFSPRKTPLCGWCPYQAQCPLFGGQIPPAAEEDLARVSQIGPSN